MILGGEELMVLSVESSANTGERLTSAEREIEAMLCEGLSYERIAAIRGTTSFTVRKQVNALYAKRDVHSRRELIALRMRTAEE